MPRPRRKSPFDTVMHVYTKYIPELDLKKGDLHGIKGIMRQSKKRFNVHILNYFIALNHIHLELYFESKSGLTVSKYMQWLLTKTAKYVNRVLKRRGSVFYDRFKSKIINTWTYFNNLLAYIAMNARKHYGIDPATWGFSGYDYYINDIPDDIITHYSRFINQRL